MSLFQLKIELRFIKQGNIHVESDIHRLNESLYKTFRMLSLIWIFLSAIEKFTIIIKDFIRTLQTNYEN